MAQVKILYCLLIFIQRVVCSDLQCNLSEMVKGEIASYEPIVEKITNRIMFGEYKGTTYKHLATFIDTFGNRMTGTANLEKSIDYMLKKSIEFNLENVHGEKVEVPHWVRGKESATLLAPHRRSLEMLGLGSSIGTTKQGIRAEALVVKSFDELHQLSSKVKRKIVVFNQDFVNYGVSVAYREYGASNASAYGAVATLIRSVTPFSLNTPHTGWQYYKDGIPKIPTACITVEDANMLQRMQDRGQKLVIRLRMHTRNLRPVTSRNTVAEIVGYSQPEKIVVISGHIDSWDVGQGALDDGGGIFLSWNAAVLLKALGLRPKRTIRTVLWTAEEVGVVGSASYVKDHQHETSNLNFVMESDAGVFTPRGLVFSGTPAVGCILQEILKLFQHINSTALEQSNSSMGVDDLVAWFRLGIPGAGLLNKAERYFWYHHTAADRMDVIQPGELDKATVLWASVAYIIADLSFDMPRSVTMV